MKRSTIIATCLVNSRFFSQLEEAEHAVSRIFAEEFPREDYATWNRQVNDQAAAAIIKAVGRASRIAVGKFIDDLRDY